MAERELIIYGLGKTCSHCSAGTEDPSSQNQDCYKCLLALLEQGLKRTPTAKDVESWRGWFNAENIPTGCPNGYHSPDSDSLPLR